MKSITRSITRVAVIAALYAALTIALYPLSFGPLQFRFSEVLTVLPLFFVEAIPGLAIGCFLANIASGPIDMLVGTVATLISAILTFRLKKIYLGVIPPIVINALLVPIIFLTIPDITEPYWFNVLTVGLGQMGVILALGIPFYFGFKKISKIGLFDSKK